MPPEAGAEERNYDERVDIWSTGVMVLRTLQRVHRPEVSVKSLNFPTLYRAHKRDDGTLLPRENWQDQLSTQMVKVEVLTKDGQKKVVKCDKCQSILDEINKNE